jgi:hypothetical protein
MVCPARQYVPGSPQAGVCGKKLGVVFCTVEFAIGITISAVFWYVSVVSLHTQMFDHDQTSSTYTKSAGTAQDPSTQLHWPICQHQYVLEHRGRTSAN